MFLFFKYLYHNIEFKVYPIHELVISKYETMENSKHMAAESYLHRYERCLITS